MAGLHHIALGATDVERVAAFYADVFGLARVARHQAPSGALRSIWLQLGDAMLMIEKSEAEPHQVVGVGRGPFLIAMSVSPLERSRLEVAIETRGGVIEERTAFSSYTRDPEGNRVAFSHYPAPAPD